MNFMPQAISLIDVVPLLPQLEAGQLIVTPNQRLASRIVTAYGLHQQQQGKAVVAAPPGVIDGALVGAVLASVIVAG